MCIHLLENQGQTNKYGIGSEFIKREYVSGSSEIIIAVFVL